MNNMHCFYIGGEWVAPVKSNQVDICSPATELPIARIFLGSAEDVDLAVAAAREAFLSYSRTSVAERLAILERMQAIYVRRQEEIAQAITAEIGSPIKFSREAQVPMALMHFDAARIALQEVNWLNHRGTSAITREPIGVVGLITPWNWPANMVACKTIPRYRRSMQSSSLKYARRRAFRPAYSIW
jgi:aldehyde dehydrogenase (NAD+)